MKPHHGPVLVYDGACAVCSGSIRLILRHDPRGPLRFASRSGEFAARLGERHAELRDAKTLIWLDRGPDGAERLRVRSEALMAVAAYLGGWWRLGLAARILPRPVRDAAYAWFARNRQRFAGTSGECFVPDAECRARFLDDPPS